MARGQSTSKRTPSAMRAAMNRPRGAAAGASAPSALELEEKRKRKEKRIRKRVDEAQAQIGKGIEAIRDSAEFRNYLDTLARFHRYSAHNNMLIHWQRPDATRVASESAWKKLGRTVTAEESRTPIRILTPRTFIKTTTDENGEEKVEKFVSPHRFGTANVFDISQTEGKELPAEPAPAPLEGTSDEAEETVQAIARWCRREKIRFGAEPGVAGGARSSGDTITIDSTLPHNQRALLFAQEAARTALVRDPKLYGSLSADERELTLQGAAYAIASGCGLDATQASFPAMAKVASERKSVDRALRAIQKVTHAVLGEPEPDPKAEGK